MEDDRPDVVLLAAADRDPAAFRELYNRWAERLLKYCYRRTFDPEVALDLTAETFAIAYEKRRQYHDRGRSVGAWLHGIARREIYFFHRKQRVQMDTVRRLGIQVPQLDSESTEEINRVLEADAWRDHLRRALSQLSDNERQAVGLRVLEQLDYRAIATRLNVSEEAARVRVHRGLNRLASRIERTTIYEF